MEVIMATSLGPSAGERRMLRAFSKTALVVAALFSTVGLASADEWQIEPFVEFVATYTDNMYLGAEGNEVSGFVGQVNPGISLREQQGRFRTNTRYRLQSLFFTEDSDFDTVLHQLDSSSTLDVVDERLFVDITASIDQSIVDPRASIPTSNVVATENLGDVFLGDINPYFIQPLGSNTALRLDYLWGVGRYDGFGLDNFSRVDDFTRDMASFSIGNGQQESGLEWSLGYVNENVDYDTATDFKFERALVEVGVPVSRTFRLVATAGRESDLLVSLDEGGLDSDIWEVGVRINSGPNKSLELRTGERFFGTSYFGNLAFQGRRLGLSLTYSEDPVTSALGGLGSLVIDFTSGLESDGEPPTEDDINIGPIRAEVYVSKTVRARIDLEGARSGVFVSYSEEDREFLEDPSSLGGTQDGQSAGTVGLTYEFGPRTGAELSASRLHYDYADTLVSTKVTQANLGVVRQVGRESELRINYRHILQHTDSVSGFDNYTENAVDIAFVWRF